MEVQRQLSPRGREALTHYRRRTPDGERERDNWAAIERKLAAGAFVHEGDVHRFEGVDELDARDELDELDELCRAPGNDRRARLRSSDTARWLAAVGTSIAIAAAVLALLRGVLMGVTALAEDARTLPSQAVDAESHGDEERTWQGRAPAPKPADGKARHDDEHRDETPLPVAETPLKPTAVAPERAASRGSTPQTTTPDPSPRARPAAEAPAPTLGEETQILSQARTALAEARYGDASTLARDYQRRFPEGAFVEELHAIHAIASCKQGIGGDSLAAFEARHPGSPLLPRVQHGCEMPQ